ncbi:MFS transporter [Haliea sp. E1-2-M8]|uniref:MFS transporter n=1 Tax=Haliea sp. E1-2-M8 TaxID=3064706 RepID=UPI00271BD1D9|nr:MFS transporter [Haliea sp. E1-2-M8]MDO8862001.1 MFS transporter [Haliea sp. E1-2-M8]
MSKELTHWQSVLYGLPAAPMAILTVPLLAYLPPYYAGTLGFSLTGIGLVFFCARLWDGITDPAIGLWSDRIKARSGGRKSWLILGLPLLLLSFYCLTHPPEGAGLPFVMLWLILTYLAWTMIQIPYLSWGAELSADYRIRNRICGWREGFGIVGIMLAAAIPLLGLGEDADDLSRVIHLTFLVVLVLLPLNLALSMFTVPEGQHYLKQSASIRDSLASAWSNRPLRQLLLAVLCYRTAWSVFDATFVLYILEILQLEFGFLPLILVQYLASIVFSPFLILLANRFGKHIVLSMSLFAGGLFLLLLYCFPPVQQPVLALIYWFLLGLGNAALWLLPTSIIADTVDYGIWRGFPAHSGLYMAAFNFIQKISLGLGIALAFPLLDLLGFRAGGEFAVQNPAVLEAITCIAPASILVVAGFWLRHFPITEKRQRILKVRIARRNLATD